MTFNLPDLNQYVLYCAEKDHTGKVPKENKAPTFWNGAKLKKGEMYQGEWRSTSELPHRWASFQKAQENAGDCVFKFGKPYEIGFLITENDPYFFIDVDECIDSQGNWSDFGRLIWDRFEGCYREISSSGAGIHVLGRGVPHIPSTERRIAIRTEGFKLEVYTEGRYIALNPSQGSGDSNFEATSGLRWVIDTYCEPGYTRTNEGFEWTEEPVSAQFPTSIEGVLELAMRDQRQPLQPESTITFKELYSAELRWLKTWFPSNHNIHPFDRSSAFFWLAKKLAFYSGNNCELIEKIFETAPLYRYSNGDAKYAVGGRWMRSEHGILGACAQQANTGFYTFREASADDIDIEDLVKKLGTQHRNSRSVCPTAALLSHKGDKLLDFFESRETGIIDYNAAFKELAERAFKRCKSRSATLEVLKWSKMPSEDVDLDSIVDNLAELPSPASHLKPFEGCTVTVSPPGVVLPNGSWLAPKEANVHFSGGYFPVSTSPDGEVKTVKTFWDYIVQARGQFAFTNKVHTFEKSVIKGPGEVYDNDLGQSCINAFYDVPYGKARKGDISPLIELLHKMLPNEKDRNILWYWMCRAVQHRGKKIGWCPILQGTFGNGKSTFLKATAYAVGGRTVAHPAKSKDLFGRFMDWVEGKYLIYVDESKIPRWDDVLSIIRNLITEEVLSVEGKGRPMRVIDNVANLIMSMNPQDGVYIDPNERRWAPLFTAHQTEQDIIRDGLDDNWGRWFKAWYEECGKERIAYELQTCTIPDEFMTFRAPKTSSWQQAVLATRSDAALELQRCIDEGLPGFRGGWISSSRATDATGLKTRSLNAALKEIGYIPHPNLGHGGKATRPVAFDLNTDGVPRRSRLLIHKDDEQLNDICTADVVSAYEKAQEQAE